MKLAERRIASSSSTRCTLRSVSAILVPRSVGQREMKGGPAELRRLGPDPSIMAVNDGVTDREAKPHPLRLGAHERLEQMLGDLRRQAGAAVLDGDPDPAPILAPRGDTQPAD